MTSKNSFFKIMKNDFQRRIWVFALIALAFFVFVPLIAGMSISTYDGMAKNIIIREYANLAGYNNVGIYFATMLAALICAFSGFSYLYSKSKVDLFHSIPVKREELFVSSYLNGIIMYVSAYIVSLLIYFGIGLLEGIVIGKTFLIVGMFFLNSLAYFFLIYNVIILAIVLTGNIIVGVLGSGVLCFYASYILVVKEAMFSGLFQTYYGGRSSLMGISDLSPVLSYMRSTTNFYADEYSKVLMRIAIVVIVAIVILVLDIISFKKRPSEACNKSMAFEAIKIPIRILLIIPTAILGGIFFKESVSGSSSTDMWMLFGIVFVSVILHGIIEMIYNADFRKFFNYKIQLLAVTVVSIFIVFGANYDLFGYDSYLADKSDIKEVYIDFTGLEPKLNYYAENNWGGFSYDSDYRIENVKIEDIDTAYDVLKYCAENVGKDNKEKSAESIRVRYVKNNGREVERYYNAVSYDNIIAQITDIYETQYYKNKANPIMERDIASISQIDLYIPIRDYNTTLVLSEDEKEELINALKQDINNRSVENITDHPITYLNFYINLNEAYTMEDGNYYIYPSDKNTIELLEKYSDDYKLDFNKYEITSISMEKYIYEGMGTEEIVVDAKEGKGFSSYAEGGVQYIEIKDKEKIEEIKEYLYLEAFTWYGNYNNIFRNDIYAYVNCISQTGEKITLNARLYGDDLPDWVNDLTNTN